MDKVNPQSSVLTGMVMHKVSASKMSQKEQQEPG